MAVPEKWISLAWISEMRVGVWYASSMSDYRIGDRVEALGSEGRIVDVFEDGMFGVIYDGGYDQLHEGDLKRAPGAPMSLLEEVQPLINALVSTGQDRPRLLAKQVAQLLAGSRGNLSRAEKLQAAAMLLVSAGLAEFSGEGE